MMMEEKIVVDVSLPTSWQELDQKQLLFVYSVIAADFSADELRTLCFIKWSGMKVLEKTDRHSFVVKHKEYVFELEPVDVAMALSALDWILDVPDMPVRLEKIGKARPVDAFFRGLKLEWFLVVEALWSQYLESRDEQLLRRIASVLYQVENPKMTKVHQVNIIYWMSSLKKFLANRFSEIYSSSSRKGDGTGSLGRRRNSPEESANAMIRALTKGDITKEREILDSETWRALTELNEQAREYRTLNEQINSKKK